MALFDIGRILSRTVINTPLLSTLHRFFMAAAPKNFSSFPTKILPLNCSQLATSPRVARNNEATLVNEPDAQRDNPLIEFALSHSFGNRPVIRRIDFFFFFPPPLPLFRPIFHPRSNLSPPCGCKLIYYQRANFSKRKISFKTFLRVLKMTCVIVQPVCVCV